MLSLGDFQQLRPSAQNSEQDNPLYDSALGVCHAPNSPEGMAALYGNQYMNGVLSCPAQGPAPTAPTGARLNDDPALDDIAAALNDTGLSVEERAQLVLSYRNKQLARVPVGAMQSMRDNDPAFPMYGSGAKKGLHHPLYEKLAADPQMQQMMAGLSSRILAQNPQDLDIQTIWAETQADALGVYGEAAHTDQTNLAALQAMATLSNYYKFDPAGPPPAILAQLPPGMWDQIQKAGEAITYSPSPDAAVMSQGVPAQPGAQPGAFTADRNFHFFSHAYLTASLIEEHGVNAHQAQAVSGFSGAQYELMPNSLREGSGNSALKDVLVNAEGAAFGAALMQDPCSALPAQMDGPPVEDRTIPTPTTLPAGAQALSDGAQDLSASGLAGSMLQGLFGNKHDVEMEVYEQTGIPPQPSVQPGLY